MKKEYSEPIIEIINLNNIDIVTESYLLGGNNAGDISAGYGEFNE